MNIKFDEYTNREAFPQNLDEENAGIPHKGLSLDPLAGLLTDRSKTPQNQYQKFMGQRNKKLFQKTLYFSSSQKGLLKPEDAHNKNSAREINSEKNMLLRIGKLQNANSQLLKQLHDKKEQIIEYEREVNLLKSLIEEEHLDHYNCIIKQNERLKTENEEMKRFLQDYGFKWLGSRELMLKEKEEENKKLFDILKREHTNYQEPLFRSPSMSNTSTVPLKDIQQKIDELNEKAERQYAKRKNGTAILDKSKPLILSLYRNGLKFTNIPYYPYICKEAQEILQDIFDGFFPTKLKGKFYECTPIILVDETDQLFVPQLKKIMAKQLEEEQLSLSKKTTISASLSKLKLKLSNLNNGDQSSTAAQELISKEKKMMAESLIGKITSQLAPPEVIEVETEISKQIKAFKQVTFPRENLVEVTVKTESKKKVLQIKMGTREAAQRLLEYVFPYRENTEIKSLDSFELRTVFPIIKLRNGEKRTLEDLGFGNKKSLGLYLIDNKQQQQ